MKNTLRRLGTLIVLALLVAPAGAVPAQDEGQMMAEVTLAGQLGQDAAGGFVLVEEESGEEVRLEGSAELADHIGAKVEVTGEWAKDADGNEIFRVSKVKRAA